MQNNWTGKRYDHYQESGVEWLGKVPRHWTLHRIKNVAVMNPATYLPNVLEESSNSDFLPMSQIDEVHGVIKGYISEQTSTLVTGYTRFKNGDILFAKITPCMENGNCAIVRGLTSSIGFGSTEFVVFRVNKFVSTEYLRHFLHSDGFRKNAEPHMKGSAGQKRISTLYLATHILPTPPLPEQKTIAAYLDAKTSGIDQKVALLEKKIETYKLLKSSLISETVTKGLNKKVKLKDSGIEWIGMVPEHWEVIRNKDVFEERVDLSATGSETLMTVSHITGVTRRSEKNVNMFMAETMEGYKCCKVGDLVINTMWAWMGALGTAQENGICSPAYGVYKPRKGVHYIPKYFDYLYRTKSAIMEMTKNSRGIVSSRLRLYPKDFFQINTAVPDMKEQTAITDYLNTQTSLIDSIVTSIGKQIESLKELRKTLINDVVTGKIKVID